jgi:putative phosphoesterase
MKIGILSDTHDQLDRTQRAVRALQAAGAEALIHCGDLTRPKIVTACAVLPCHFVFGNNDVDDVPSLRAAMAEAEAVCLEWGGTVTLAGKRLAVTHGHITAHVRRLLAEQPEYLCTGHSHIAHDWRDGPTRRINPGALYRAAEYSVAVLDLATDTLEFIPILR